jgi:DNA-directed RNA polymerase III subunit RPC6
VTHSRLTISKSGLEFLSLAIISTMAGRPPNEFERKLHQAALADPKKVCLAFDSRSTLKQRWQELTAKQSEAIVPDLSDRRSALNFLLGVGLFKLLKDGKGNVSFRAVLKTEMNA